MPVEVFAETRKQISLLPALACAISRQVCSGICMEKIPGFEYFGTQYGNEVRGPVLSSEIMVSFGIE